MLLAAACGHAAAPQPRPVAAPAPAVPATRTALADCPKELLASAEPLAEDDREGAAALLRRCLEPTDPPAAWRLLASLELEAERDRRARRTLLAAVVHHPEDAYAWLALARLELAEGRTLLGLGAVERAYRARPADPVVAQRYQTVLRRHGRPEQRRAARIAPLLTEADGRLELGDAAGALRTLEAASAAAGDDEELGARIALRRGLVFVRQGRFDAAAAAVTAGLERLPRLRDRRLEVDLHLLDSEVALGLDDPERSLAAADRALALRPRHPLAHTNRALACLRLGRASAAVTSLLAALDAGLSRRLGRADFLGLPGVNDLLAGSPELARRVDATWPTEVSDAGL